MSLSMTRVSAESILKRLNQRRQAILQNRVGKEAEAPVSDHPADFLSQASLGNIQDMSLALRDKQLKNLKDIDLEIERVANGEYGICTDCEDPIPQKRLDAFPETSLCLICKEAEEALQKTIVPESCPIVDMGVDFSIGTMMERNLAL